MSLGRFNMGKLPPIDLVKLNKQYPCDKRGGYGRGCQCGDPDGVDRNLIRCNHQMRNMRLRGCQSCRYQKKYIEKLKKKEEESINKEDS